MPREKGEGGLVTFSVAAIKHYNQKHLKEEFILGYGSIR